MGKYAKLTDWELCGFESRGAMRDALALADLTDRDRRARFRKQVLRGPKEGLADRLRLFNSEPATGDPFYVEGPAAIGVSGGRTSGYMLWRILQAHGGQLPDDVLPIFQNTGKERDETLDFLHEIETRWNVPLIWLEYVSPETLGAPPRESRWVQVTYETAYRDSWPDDAEWGDGTPRRRPFNALFDTYAAYRATKDRPPLIPNVRQRICTAEMKMKTQKRYLKARGWDCWDRVTGIRADEPRRVANARLSLASEREEPTFPLHNAGVTEADVMAFWAAQNFDLGLQQGEGNCDLCYLKSVPTQLMLLKRYPERAQWWTAREDEVGDVFRRDLSRNTKGPRGFRKMLKRAGELSEEQILEMGPRYAPSIPCSCTD